MIFQVLYTSSYSGRKNFVDIDAGRSQSSRLQYLKVTLIGGCNSRSISSFFKMAHNSSINFLNSHFCTIFFPEKNNCAGRNLP
uniref:Uncharacterized protein n=1 Tax=Romanomermis culicivorax TaxID=13658 RepID=A0A915L159_ROMCU